MAAPTKPLEPDSTYGMDQALEALKVAVHSKVIEVTSDASDERGVLRLDRVMPVAPAVPGDRVYRPRQARVPGLGRAAYLLLDASSSPRHGCAHTRHESEAWSPGLRDTGSPAGGSRSPRFLGRPLAHVPRFLTPPSAP